MTDVEKISGCLQKLYRTVGDDQCRIRKIEYQRENTITIVFGSYRLDRKVLEEILAVMCYREYFITSAGESINSSMCITFELVEAEE